MNRTEHTYNATMIFSDADGKPYCWGLVQAFIANGKTKIFRSNGYWTSNNGTEAYHEDYIKNAARTLAIGGEGSTLELVVDGGAAYKSRLGMS
jgi:hypothetical protein